MTVPTAADFEREAIQASQLYISAQNLRDKGAPNSMANVVTKQFLDLEKEKKVLEKELQTLKAGITSHERDFLDHRGDSPVAMPTTLQDSAFTIFLFSWVLFSVILLWVSFSSGVRSGIYMIVGIVIGTFIMWGLIYNYA